MTWPRTSARRLLGVPDAEHALVSAGKAALRPFSWPAGLTPGCGRLESSSPQTPGRAAHVVAAAAAGEEQEAPAPRTPPALVAPVLLILAVAKNPDALAVIPALSGFFMQKIAAVAQIAYDFESKAERKMS